MTTNKELESELAQARKDIATLASLAGEKARARTNGIAEGLEVALNDLSKEARSAFEHARSEGAAARGAVEGQIKENPLLATGIAFGAGILVAALLGRR
ncbi:MAG: hypothetical protein LJE62_04455 [Silicimonas sp.]|jgi:ElaB/YqjD/DUF883 family membrane-anchored ribosome-binding protein|nr:hypothetical protein [Silicimonas sp.]